MGPGTADAKNATPVAARPNTTTAIVVILFKVGPHLDNM